MYKYRHACQHSFSTPTLYNKEWPSKRKHDNLRPNHTLFIYMHLLLEIMHGMEKVTFIPVEYIFTIKNINKKYNKINCAVCSACSNVYVWIYCA